MGLVKSIKFVVAGWLCLPTTAAVHAFQYPDCIHGFLSNNTVCNSKATPSERAAALVKAMNVTEKLSNLVE